MGVPSIRYLEACRETGDKNILGKRVGYNGEGWRQRANIGAKVLLGSPKTLIFFLYIKFVKRGLENFDVAK